MSTLRLVAVTAGMSQPSSTRLLTDRLTEAVRRELADRDPGTEVKVETIELRELAVDIAHAMVTGFAAGRLREALDNVAQADGLIAVTPVFSASYSGLFKSFFDVLDPKALIGTPVLIAATGGSARHSLVLDYAMRPLFSYLKATIVGTGVFAATADFGSDDAGRSLADRVHRAAGELVGLLAPVPRLGSQVAAADIAPSPGRSHSSTVGRPDREPDPFESFVPFAELLGRR